jgi:hypothetical protein
MTMPFRLAPGWLLLGLGLLLLLVNPYGIGLPMCWIETLRMPLPEIIQEHRPAGWNDLGILGAGGLGIAYVIILCGISPRQVRVTWLIPVVWMVFGALRVRFLPLAGLTTALALAEMLPASRWAGWLQGRGLLGKPFHKGTSANPVQHKNGKQECLPSYDWCKIILPFLFPGLLILIVFVLQGAGVSLPVVGRGWTEFDPRIAPNALLEEIAGITGDAAVGKERIFNDLNFGGFLIYNAPRLKIFIDDRCLLYGTEFLRAYDEARRNAPETIEHWRRQYGFRYALVEADGRFDSFLAGSGRWTALARTPVAALYRCDLDKTSEER